MKIASIDVDAQKCFTPLCPHELPVPEGDQIVSELNQQAALATLRIGTKDAHSPAAIWIATDSSPQLTPLDGKHADLYWNQHAIPGQRGFELLEGLPHPADYDFFIWKGIEPDMHPYGACYHDLKEQLSTGLIEYLTTQHIDLIVVGGLALDYCVKITVLQLLKARFPVVVNQAACRGIAPVTVAQAIQEMKNKGAQFVKNAQMLEKMLTSTPHPTPFDIQDKSTFN